MKASLTSALSTLLLLLTLAVTAKPTNTPSISLVATGFLNQGGSKITYYFKATNTGNVTLQDVMLSDALTGTSATMSATLAPGGTVTITREYSITQSNLDNGFVLSSSAVLSQTADGITVTDVSDEGNPDNGDSNPTVVLTKFGALSDDTATVAPGQSVTISLLANDLFIGNPDAVVTTDSISLNTITVNNNGTASVLDDTVTFTAAANTAGPLFISYYVTLDGVSLSARLYLNIAPTPTPVITALDDYESVTQGTGIDIHVLGNDSFGPAGMGSYPLEIVQPPQYGYAFVADLYNTPTNPFDDYIIYVAPSFGYIGTDTILYKIKDALGNEAFATVAIYIYPNPDYFLYTVNDSFVTNFNTALTVNPTTNDNYGTYGYAAGSFQVISQPQHGTALVDNTSGPYPTLTYTPQDGYVGYDSIGYVIADNMGNTASATISITVLGPTYIKAGAFLDTNGNGTKDSGEYMFRYGKLTYQTTGAATIDMQTSEDYFYIPSVQAYQEYSLSYATQNASFTANPSSFNNVVASNGENLVLFPVTAVPFKDGAVVLYAQDLPRPGFTQTIGVKYTNRGNQTIPGGNLTFIKPADFTIQSVSQSGINTTPAGFTYNFTDLQPYETRDMTVTYQVPNIPSVSLGQLVTSSVFMTDVTDDTNLSNNIRSETNIIVGSFDPNDITESHGGEILTSAFTSTDLLYYTVRFENTGTAAAEDVTVSQSLDPKLDPASLVIIDASSNYAMTRQGTTATWKLDDINLAPSIPNTPTGKGYIQYSIKPLPGYHTGDIIGSSANIVFDSNPAIVTENFNTKFVSALGIPDNSKLSLSLSPNPVNDILTITAGVELQSVSILSETGQVVLQQQLSGRQAQLDLRAFQAGVYLVTVNGKTVKIIKK